MNIKICGVSDMKQLAQLEGLDIEFAGLNFRKGSANYVGEQIRGAELKKADLDIRTVGVFHNPEMIEVLDAIDEYGIDIVELTGEEGPEICADLSEEVEVMKKFHLSPGSRISVDKLVAPYDAVCDYFMFGAQAQENLAGSVLQFDWELLRSSRIEKPFFIAGIGPADAEKVLSFSHPDFFGIELGPGFDKEPGVKDLGAILGFRRVVRG